MTDLVPPTTTVDTCPGSLIDPGKHLCNLKTGLENIKDPVDAVTQPAINAFAGTIRSGIAWVFRETFMVWFGLDSIHLQDEAAVWRIQEWIMPISLSVATLAVVAAGGRMALTRKSHALVDVGQGVLIITATAGIGVFVPTLLLDYVDQWSVWVLSISTDRQAAGRLYDLLTLTAATTVPNGTIIILGSIILVLIIIQALLMLFRQAALVVLCGLLPLAAAGTLAPSTRVWFKKIAAWMLALIFYKAAVAAVYATAFTMIGKGTDSRTTLMGLAMLVLSLIAMPVLLQFFTWATGAIGSGGGGQLLSTGLSAVDAVGSFRRSSGGVGGQSAADQARNMDLAGNGTPNDQQSTPPPGPRPVPDSTPSPGGDGDGEDPTPVRLAVHPTPHGGGNPAPTGGSGGSGDPAPTPPTPTPQGDGDPPQGAPPGAAGPTAPTPSGAGHPHSPQMAGGAHPAGVGVAAAAKTATEAAGQATQAVDPGPGPDGSRDT
ncbi:hypothetical protein [Thermomonospora umbrina]|uniref:TrbL/VirB6 plasmid conjugal transfer protein n=1 Tax=Thermomonospora umbrina TaxID=111806 RepID=A0A3D9T7I3_9ACTN|nr:hypothetical protein [Thermomonospora umbrina]REF00635.1 hypothetical protein DFJ69_6191 [Thermomonospora umbrina]